MCLLIFLVPPLNCSQNETQEASGLCSHCPPRKRPAYCNCSQENVLTCAVCTVFFILLRFCCPTKSQLMAMYVIGRIRKKLYNMLIQHGRSCCKYYIYIRECTFSLQMKFDKNDSQQYTLLHRYSNKYTNFEK